MTWGPTAQTKSEAATKQLEALINCKAAYVQSGPEAGKILIDSARIYQSGQSEEQLGAILKEHPDWAKVISLHTKCNSLIQKLTRDSVIKQCNDSLKALGVKCLDIFYVHSPDISVDYEETFGALNELHREGKFKELGLSAFAAWDVMRVSWLCKEKGWVRPTVYQGVYNAINRNAEPELLPALRTLGIRFYVYNPLAAGVLTGRYKSVKDAENLKEGRFSTEFDLNSKDPNTKPSSIPSGKVHLILRGALFKEQLFKSLDIISEACAKANIPMAEAALRWLAHHSALKGHLHDGILFGASNPDQMQQNLASYQASPLPSSIVAAYEDAWKVAKTEAESYFRGYSDTMYGGSNLYLAKF